MNQTVEVSCKCEAIPLISFVLNEKTKQRNIYQKEHRDLYVQTYKIISVKVLCTCLYRRKLVVLKLVILGYKANNCWIFLFLLLFSLQDQGNLSV